MSQEDKQGKGLDPANEAINKGLVTVPKNLKEMTDQERDLWAEQASSSILKHLLRRNPNTPS